MKKRKAFILLIAALAMIVSGAMLGCSGKPEIVFADEGTNLTYVSDGDYYFADFGTPVVLRKRKSERAKPSSTRPSISLSRTAATDVFR